MIIDGKLFDLGMARTAESRRSSSYARDGSNVDFRRIPAGQTLELLSAEGPGIVTHIWFALADVDPNYLRRLVIRAWWDGEAEPSVNCPLGDFLGVGHAITNKYECAIMNMARGDGGRGGSTGGNCYLQMPFAESARIVVVNESPLTCGVCYYHVDWLKTGADAVDGAGRFHALWHRENPCDALEYPGFDNRTEHGRYRFNLDGRKNFAPPVIRGTGRFIGCNLSIDDIDSTHMGNYVCCFNEGDDWIYIDSDKARIRGTGTEDYFNDAWGMTGHAGLWAGTSLHEEEQRKKGRRAKGTCYRFHIPDPLYFKESFRITFEHGHANHQANDLAATCYWYQHEPHASFPLPPVESRLPVPEKDAVPQEIEKEIVAMLCHTRDTFYDIFLDGTQAQLKRLPASNALGTVGDILDNHLLKGTADLDAIRARLDKENAILADIAATR